MPIIKISRPKGGKSIKNVNKRPQKGPKRPVPQARRDSSSSLSSPADLSDDGGYSAVENVSDSEDDDEEHVVAAEEEHIISDEERDALPSSPRPRTSMFEDDDDEAADADNDESDDHASQQGMQSFSSDVDFDDAADESSDDSESWNGFSLEDEPAAAPVDPSSAEQPETPVQRHVRFAGVPDSESESDETEDDHDDFFPDIFVEQESLEPNFRREIEQDDDDDNSSVSLTFWDHTGGAEAEEESEHDHDDDESMGFPWEQGPDILKGRLRDVTPTDLSEVGRWANSEHEAAADSAAEPTSLQDDEESDGYESDGDTTEDDEPVLLSSRRHSTPVRPATSGKASDTDPDDGHKTGDAESHTTRLPIRTSNKPICVLNPITRKMMIFTPQKIRRPSQMPPDYFPLPMTGTGSFSLNAALNSGAQSDMMALAPTGDPWSFGALTMLPSIPFNDPSWSPPLGIRAAPSDDSSYLGDGEGDPEEMNLNIDDFITFDEGSDAEEGDGENTDEGNGDGAETPSRRSSTAASADGNPPISGSARLEHLMRNPGSVGAFRLNQTNKKLILTGMATADSLDFSGPYTHGTLRGIKHGSLRGAATPLTPERRHKKTPAKSPLEVAAQKKRKASGMAAEHSLAHKRHRSISDVKSMHI